MAIHLAERLASPKLKDTPRAGRWGCWTTKDSLMADYSSALKVERLASPRLKDAQRAGHWEQY